TCRTPKIWCRQAMHAEREADLAAVVEVMLNEVPDHPLPREALQLIGEADRWPSAFARGTFAYTFPEMRFAMFLHSPPDCYRYLFERSNSSLNRIFWPVGAVIMAHFRRHSRRFSPFSSHPENTGNSQKPRQRSRIYYSLYFLANILD